MSSRKSRGPKRRAANTIGHWLGLFFLEGLAVGVILYLIAVQARQTPKLPTVPPSKELADQSSAAPMLSIDANWRSAP